MTKQVKLYNTLTRRVDDLITSKKDTVTMYTCGPTLYDHVHIGNLSSFIYADTLKRTLKAAGYKVKHVMNYTDVDDKTITKSRQMYPDDDPNTALKKLTKEYEKLFLDDMKTVGNEIDDIEFLSATEHIPEMQVLITELYRNGFAYIAEDGVYFSIEAYKKTGKIYGQLTKVTSANTSSARISNDEYDKDNVHDFALWKLHKAGEPSWDFELGGHNLPGRPGWHIECSAMSTSALGQPFDIHTGGVDLIFPHHENEIAQSTAGKGSPFLANLFFHNEHLLVDGKKMSKSLNNFYTLNDIRERGFEPLAFRLMILQSHYRNQSNFTWENLESAQNRLKELLAIADLVFQTGTAGEAGLAEIDFEKTLDDLQSSLGDDINTPMMLRFISEFITDVANFSINQDQLMSFKNVLKFLDSILGTSSLSREDISVEQKRLLQERENSRKESNWQKSDDLRNKLKQQRIEVRDTPHGQIWNRI